MTPATAWQELEQSLGRERVQAEPGVVVPASVEEAVEAMRWAARHHVPVISGRHVRHDGTSPSAMRLDLSRLQATRFHEPGDLTMGVDAGITVGELQRRLAAAHQFLPLDVAAAEPTSLGAVLACHRSGPLRHAYGTVRDFVIGIEAITADGTLIHGGGKVVKNVAGYDVMKLLIGSRGTLAVITGVHFRVFPMPGTRETLVLGPLSWEQAEQARQWMQHSYLHPMAFELSREAGDAGLRVLVRVAGRERVRARYRSDAEAWAQAHRVGCERLEGQAEEQLWAGLQEFPAITDGASTLRLSAPPARAVPLLAQWQQQAEQDGYRFGLLGRLGLGVFAVRTTPAVTPEHWQRWRGLAAAAEAWLQVEPGSAPGEAWAAGAPGLAMMRTIKQELDPEGRLNPQWSLADA